MQAYLKAHIILDIMIKLVHCNAGLIIIIIVLVSIVNLFLLIN
jgi:hypothetical protein